jgi:hypothetical protein
MELTNANHVGAQETLQRQRDENLESKRASKRDQTEDGNDGGCGVNRVEGNVPLVVPSYFR